ncbi:MAG: MaoC/PaaZ C-terminal domain-containing protein [Pseudomonadota bacterium]
MKALGKGKYFDDLEIGDEFYSISRSITEADIINFCGVSGDFNQLHTDIEFAVKGPFGQRIAHGMCGLTIASGCLNRSGLMEGTTVAFKGIKEWSFKSPIFINDTIQVKIQVKDRRESKKPDRGLICFWLTVMNQREEVVMEGQFDVLMSRKPHGK